MSVIKNYLYNLSYQILLLIVPLITMPHLARTLGIDNQGTFSILYSVVSVFVMLGCVGLNVYGQREIAYYRDDPEKCNRVFWEIEIIRIITLYVSLIAYFGFAFLNVNVRSFINVGEFLYFALFSLEIVSSMLDISWYYQGIENFRFQTVRNFAVKLISLVLILTLVRTENHLWLYTLIYIGSNLVGNGALWFDRLKNSRPCLPGGEIFRKHIKGAFILFLPQIATIIYAQLDRVMVGSLINDGNFQAGVYDNGEKIVKIALTVVTSIGYVMLSRVANTFKSNQQEKTKEYIESSFRLYTCLATPIMFGLMGIAENFIPAFFIGTEGADKITPVMFMLCPIILFIGGSNVFGTQYLLPTNRMKPYILSVFTGMVTNVMLNLVFIPKMGALGAALATVIAEFAVLVIQLVAVRKTFSALLYIRSWRNFIAGVIMFAAVYSLTPLGHGLTFVVLQICAGVFVYFGLLIVLRDSFVLKYLKALLKKLKIIGERK